MTHNGDTKMRVHVDAATKPFWLVLGESQSPGWHARVVGGHDLGPSQLVDGYANGWLVTPPASGAFDVVFEWTPQRQVRTAIWLSLLGVAAVPGDHRVHVGPAPRRSWPPRRRARPGDADVDSRLVRRMVASTRSLGAGAAGVCGGSPRSPPGSWLRSLSRPGSAC